MPVVTGLITTIPAPIGKKGLMGRKRKEAGVVLYDNWLQIMAGLPENDTYQLIRLICAWKLGNEYNCTSQTAQAIFDSIIPTISKNVTDFKNRCDINKRIADEKNGNKGNDEETLDSSEIADDSDGAQTYTNVHGGARTCTNVHERTRQVHHTITKTITNTKTNTITSVPKGTQYTSSTNVDECTTRSEIDSIVERWNQLPNPVPKIRNIKSGSARMKSLNARIKEYSLEEVYEAIDNIQRSPFLLGQIKDWCIDFDWFVKPRNFIKVLEGNYLEVTPQSQPQMDYLSRRILEEEAKERSQNDTD